MDEKELEKLVRDLKGRMVALDFTVKMLIQHLPDLPAFRDHWNQSVPALTDRIVDNANRTSPEASTQALAMMLETIDAELARRQ